MKKNNFNLVEKVEKKLSNKIIKHTVSFDMVTLEVKQENLISVLKKLKDDKDFDFSQLIDLAGIDYSAYYNSEWETRKVSSSGFNRGKNSKSIAKSKHTGRFAVIYHLLSISNNVRIRIRSYTTLNEPPCIPSVNNIWNSANWFEREAFDLFGIFFVGHEDLRRILTDYGFIGHPFRKDFPLIGEMEVRYDFKENRVIYDPVSITERTLVPRVIRKDNRYI
jgi:NADH-quinone oxidoreductase subunit C